MMSEETPKAGKIHTAILKVMKEVGHIGKDRQAKAQGFTYNFRGIDDVYNALHNPMAEHGIFTTPEVIEETRTQGQYKSGSIYNKVVLRIKYHFYAEDGSEVTCTVVGEGDDGGDKASNKAMAAAHKYALLQMFMIPTEDPKDTEDPKIDATQQGEVQGGSIRQGQQNKNYAPAGQAPKGKNAAWSKKYKAAAMMRLGGGKTVNDILSIANQIKVDQKKLAVEDVDSLRTEVIARIKEIKEAVPAAQQ